MTLAPLRLLALAGLMLMAAILSPGIAAAQDPAASTAIISEFAGKKSFDETEATVRKLAATGDPAVAVALNALADGELYYRADGSVVIARGKADPVEILDPYTAGSLGTVPVADLQKVRVKNSIRVVVADALGTLTLGIRSEERRVGKECELKCRSRWSPYH